MADSTVVVTDSTAMKSALEDAKTTLNSIVAIVERVSNTALTDDLMVEDRVLMNDFDDALWYLRWAAAKVANTADILGWYVSLDNETLD